MIYYEVAVAAPLFDTLTYAQPPEETAPLPLGLRVLVPLKNRTVTGYILDILYTSPDVPYQIKAILERLDPAPLFPEQLVPFFRWLAAYYHYPLGEVIQTALPSGLRAGSGYEIILTETGRQQLPTVLTTVKKRAAWMDRLLAKGIIQPGTTKVIRTKPAMQALLQTWQRKGWIEIKEVLVNSAIKAKKETVVRLNTVLKEALSFYRSTEVPEEEDWKTTSPPLPLEIQEDLKLSERKTLELFFQHCKGSPVLPRAELTRQYSGAGKALHTLADAGLITLDEQRIYRDPFGKVPPL
ncbi:MAG: primosomal protein N', partial [Candidatus Electrothrix sp. AUS4]|nr:primosomal protein N' [Candidatus Electrothrix sp. AUS4]